MEFDAKSETGEFNCDISNQCASFLRCSTAPKSLEENYFAVSLTEVKTRMISKRYEHQTFPGHTSDEAFEYFFFVLAGRTSSNTKSNKVKEPLKNILHE